MDRNIFHLHKFEELINISTSENYLIVFMYSIALRFSKEVFYLHHKVLNFSSLKPIAKMLKSI